MMQRGYCDVCVTDTKGRVQPKSQFILRNRMMYLFALQAYTVPFHIFITFLCGPSRYAQKPRRYAG